MKLRLSFFSPGMEVRTPQNGQIAQIQSVKIDGSIDIVYYDRQPIDSVKPPQSDSNGFYQTFHYDELIPILRPITSLTDDEIQECMYGAISINSLYPEFEITRLTDGFVISCKQGLFSETCFMLSTGEMECWEAKDYRKTSFNAFAVTNYLSELGVDWYGFINLGLVEAAIL